MGSLEAWPSSQILRVSAVRRTRGRSSSNSTRPSRAIRRARAGAVQHDEIDSSGDVDRPDGRRQLRPPCRNVEIGTRLLVTSCTTPEHQREAGTGPAEHVRDVLALDRTWHATSVRVAGTATATNWRQTVIVTHERRLALAAGLDTFVVVLFVAIGRRNHDESSAVAGLAKTAAPFLVGLAAGWTAARAWRRPARIVTGLVIWPVTLLVGMIVRSTVFDDGTATAFVIVATSFLGAGFVGWRAVVRALDRRAGAPNQQRPHPTHRS